jgi:hypothetical protein
MNLKLKDNPILKNIEIVDLKLGRDPPFINGLRLIKGTPDLIVVFNY